MSVYCVRALARLVIVGALSVSPGVAAAGDLSPQPSAIAETSEVSAFGFPRLPSDTVAQEPFGSAVGQPASGALLEKWNAAKTELRIDVDIIAACRAEPDACESAAATRIIAIVEEAQKREGRALIGTINRAINLSIAAASDKIQYGVEDRWASPLMTFSSGRGDCEDYALAKYTALRAAGFGADDLRLLIVRLPQSQTDHAVLSVRHDGRWLVLDNRRFAMLDVAHLDAMPLFALRENDARPGMVAVRDGESTAANAPYLI